MGDVIFELVIRYGGYWSKKTSKKIVRYECGKQKTLKIDYDKTNFKDLKDDIIEALPWVTKYNLSMKYTIPNSTPPEYKKIRCDQDYMAMLHLYMETRKLKLFLTTDMKNAEERQEHMNAIVEDSNYVNENEGIDELDDCQSENSYHELPSSSDEEVGSLNGSDGDEAQHEHVQNYEGAQWEVQVGGSNLEIGMKFKDKEDFRMRIREHAIINNFEARFIKNEGSRFVVVCAAGSCPWRIFAKTLRQDATTVEIRTLEPKHECIGVNRIGNSQATSRWIASKILTQVKENREFTPKQISDFLRNQYQLVNIPYCRVWSAREKAREIVFGKVEEDYKYVPSLREELVTRNEGSHIVYTLHSDHSFFRFFVSFRSMVIGFKMYCRPFMGLDGCHLRSKYLGVLLSATALDGNNCLYPIAFAVVESESSDAWT